MWSPTRRRIGVELRTDGTKTQVRRPRAHRVGRRAFTSGKRKQNTLKPTVVSDGQGRTLWAGAARPGRMHDQTAVSTEGIADLPTQHPGVKVRVDQGYQGLGSAFAEQVTAPPRKPAKDAAAELVLPTGRPGPSSPPGGSAWSTRSPSTGGRCSAGSAAGSPSARPTWRSRAWSPDRAARR
jgi:hypothetical protein